jgi:hypothetical protein
VPTGGAAGAATLHMPPTHDRRAGRCVVGIRLAVFLPLTTHFVEYTGVSTAVPCKGFRFEPALMAWAQWLDSVPRPKPVDETSHSS